MNDEQLLRYSRHLLLPDIDVEGQQALLDSTVLIVGAGGLGCPAAMYLASSGIGHIILFDHDKVELSNLQRQIAHGDGDITKTKVTSLRDSLLAINPQCQVTAVHQRFSEDHQAEFLPKVDVIVDCSDNFSTRFLLNAAAVQYRIPLVSAAAIRLEAQLAVFDSRLADSPCYRCLYSDHVEVDDNCSSNGVLAPLVGMVGSMQAIEVIRLLTSFSTSTAGKLQMADLKQGGWRTLTLTKDPQCPVCSVI